MTRSGYEWPPISISDVFPQHLHERPPMTPLERQKSFEEMEKVAAPIRPQFQVDKIDRPTTVWIGNGHKVVLRTEGNRGTIKAAWLEIVVTPQLSVQARPAEDEVVA